MFEKLKIMFRSKSALRSDIEKLESANELLAMRVEHEEANSEKRLYMLLDHERESEHDRERYTMLDSLYGKSRRALRETAIALIQCGLSCEEVYNLVADVFDSEGWIRNAVCKKLLGVDVPSRYCADASLNRFECMGKDEMLRYAEAAVYGVVEYEYIGCYELVSSVQIDERRADYIAYRKQLYESTMATLLDREQPKSPQELSDD